MSNQYDTIDKEINHGSAANTPSQVSQSNDRTTKETVGTESLQVKPYIPPVYNEEMLETLDEILGDTSKVKEEEKSVDQPKIENLEEIVDVAKLEGLAKGIQKNQVMLDEIVETISAVKPTVDEEGEKRKVVEPEPPIEMTDATHIVNRTPPNVMQHFNVIGDTSSGSLDTINLPPENGEVIREIVDNLPELNMGKTKNHILWSSVLREGLSQIPLGGVYQKRLGDVNASWTQVLEHQGHKLHAYAPGLKKAVGTVEVEGERALLQMVTHLSTGSLARTPLYNSGFWVYFKPATEIELIELNAEIQNDKIQLGRSSYGLAHTNGLVYTTNRVFNFALRHVYATSIKTSDINVNDLATIIQTQDIYSFIWGFLCANYPSGFHYKVACIENPLKCQNVFEGNLALNKLLVVDESMLNDWQKTHMASFSSNSKSLESVKRYQEEVTKAQEKKIVINKGSKFELGLTIKTPSVHEYTEQGYRYISEVVNNVKRYVEDDDDSDRETHMRMMSKASTLCQYVHYVKEIEFGSISNIEEDSRYVIKDGATILDALKTLSATDSIREQIIEEITNYIGESSVSVIAMPAFDCPACKTPQDRDVKTVYPTKKNFIPLDILQVFFELLGQRIMRIQDR